MLATVPRHSKEQSEETIMPKTNPRDFEGLNIQGNEKFGPVAAALVSTLVPIAASYLFGQGGGSSSNSTLTAAAGSQAAQLDQLTRIRQLVLDILTGKAEMPRGERPPIFQLPESAGGPRLDPAFLAQLQPAISPEFSALLGLTGLPTGTSAITGAAGLAQQAAFTEQDRVSQGISGIIQALLAAVGNKGNPVPTTQNYESFYDSPYAGG